MDNQTIWAFGPLVIMLILMYFLILRPQRKRDKEINAMRASVRVGNDIVTIGGIVGKVVKVKENSLIIVVGSEKTRMEIMRWAVNSVGRPDAGTVEQKEVYAEEEEPAKAMPKKLGDKSGEEA